MHESSDSVTLKSRRIVNRHQIPLIFLLWLQKPLILINVLFYITTLFITFQLLKDSILSLYCLKLTLSLNQVCNHRSHYHSQNSDIQIVLPQVVQETLGKHPPVRWQQSFSNTSDHLVFPLVFLENDLKICVLLAALAVVVAVAMASVLAVASLNYLKIQLMNFCSYLPFPFNVHHLNIYFGYEFNHLHYYCTQLSWLKSNIFYNLPHNKSE